MNETVSNSSKINLLLVNSELDSAQNLIDDGDKAIVFFGSARLNEDNIYYQQAVELSYQLTQLGYKIITGGGPGIMEAGNRGAHMAGGTSYGLCMDFLEFEPENSYISDNSSLRFQHFFTRKFGFFHHSMGFICFPGGFGTLDELFEGLVMRQMKKISWYPIFLFGKDYWGGLFNWIEEHALVNGMISAKDMDQFILTDSSEDIVSALVEHHSLGEPRKCE